MHLRRLSPLAIAFVLLALLPSQATQPDNMALTSNLPGLTAINDINAMFSAMLSFNAGTSAPQDPCLAAPATGMPWLDTSSAPYKAKWFTGNPGIWVYPFLVDPTNNLPIVQIGGGEAILNSAATVDLGSVPQAAVRVDGNTGITSFGSSAIVGTLHVVRFTGQPPVTNGASLIIPGGNSRTPEVGEVWLTKYEGGGTWRVINIAPASGSPIAAAPVGTIWATRAFAAPSGWLFANGAAVSRATYANLFATICISQVGARTGGNGIISGLASTANLAPGMPVGGTGIGAAAVVSSIDSGSQIHVSVNSTSTGTSTVDVCPDGIGDGSTTFNLPDTMGRTLAGVDGMGGVGLTNRMSGCAHSATLSSPCGSQSVTIAQNQLPNVAPAASGTITNNNVSVPNVDPWGHMVSTVTGGISSFAFGSTGSTLFVHNMSAETSPTVPNAVGVTVNSINGGVTQQPTNVLNPVVATNYIIKF